MKVSTAPGRVFVDLDPSAFLADPDLLDALASRATPVPCDADRILFKQDDSPVGVYILHQGLGSLSMKSPEGRSILSVQALPGSLFGLPGVYAAPVASHGRADDGEYVSQAPPSYDSSPTVENGAWVQQQAADAEAMAMQQQQIDNDMMEEQMQAAEEQNELDTQNTLQTELNAGM